MSDAATATPAATPAASPTPSPSPAPAPSPTPAATPSPTPAATPTPAPAGTPSALSGDGTAAPAPTPAASTWGDDWRDQMSAGDDKFRKKMDRFASPVELARSYRALEQRISSGELKAAKLADDATPEQQADWRKENGIPDKHGDYLTGLPEGLVIGAEDKDIVDSFLQSMHKANAPAALVQQALQWNQEQKEAQLEQIHTMNQKGQQETEDALRVEYGQDYRGNINQVKALLAGAPEGVAELVANARSPDGLGIFNKPEVLKWFVQMAKEINPVPTLTGGTNSPTAIADEITQIEKFMSTNRDEYFKDEAKQKRYQDLIAARDRQK